MSFQTKAQHTISIKKTNTKITVDGELNETVWKTTKKASNFYQNYPTDTSFSLTRTEVMITYDSEHIYVAAICYDEFPEKKFTIQSLKRDFSYPVSDAFAVFIDPFNDKINGFSFAVNPLGVQREGLLQSGGIFGVTTSWDNKWFSKVKQHGDKWVVEMKIPFKTIRYKDGVKEWGINFSRNDLKRNENSSWIPVPRIYNIASLAFTGKMIWDTPPQKAGTNISLIPYAIGAGSKDFENNEAKNDVNGGFDAKIAITSSLNLDLTVNPDFSQVEVDRQITNLSRFSLFFPERRQFFIENSDLFSQFGFSQIRPFFSRKIGLNNGEKIPILAGARLSGKLNKDWRIGLMNMQTEGVGEPETNPQNYTVAAIQRRIGKRSSVDAIFVNRQGFNNTDINYGDYNRILGAEYNLRSVDGKWDGKAFYHHAYSPNIRVTNFTHGSWLTRQTDKITIQWKHEYVGENYRTDVGFVPRISQYNSTIDEVVFNSYWRFEPFVTYRFYPTSKKIQNYEADVYLNQYLNNDFKTTEQQVNLSFGVNFIDKSAVKIKTRHHEIVLPFPTDVTFSGNTKVDSGKYTFNSLKVNYQSSKFKPFNYNAAIDFGEYYIGKKLTTNASINYRIQPWGIFGISLDQNQIWMPESFNDISLWLIGPKLEFSFTKQLFFTTFFQYNTQIDNVNINARLQYRFKPMSDLFIVYTDNYNSPNLAIKNRALVVKFIYWINL